MQMQFYFKHMETSKSLEDYARNKLAEKISRFVGKPVEAKVNFSVENGTHHAHCLIKGGDGFNIDVTADSSDMYASVDLMLDKMVGLLKKQKEKLKSHKGHANIRDIAEYSNKKRERSDAPDFVDAEDILKYEAGRKRAKI